MPTGRKLPKGYRFPKGFKFPKSVKFPNGQRPQHGVVPKGTVFPSGFHYPRRGIPKGYRFPQLPGIPPFNLKPSNFFSLFIYIYSYDQRNRAGLLYFRYAVLTFKIGMK